MRIDLHTHSRVSDGTDTPAELVRAAAEAGLDVVALTDHDTHLGWAEAAEAARAVGVQLVPGMEISTDYDGHSVHLLAYLLDPSYPPLHEELARVLEGRTGRVATMVARLNALGIPVTEADVMAQASDAAGVGRPHVADALVALGVVRDRTQAFDEYLAFGMPAYVKKYDADLRRMLGLVAEAGGVSVIAHPWGRHREERPSRDAFEELHGLGLSGIEVDHQDHDESRRVRLRRIARDLGLVVTGSSDYHGLGKMDHPLGVNTTDPEEFEKLLVLATEASLASGRPTPQVVR